MSRTYQRTLAAVFTSRYLSAAVMATVAIAFAPALVTVDAQTQTPQASTIEALPEFDAVSVRPNTSGSAARAMGPEPGGRFNARNVPLRDLLAFAYAIPPMFARYRIAGGPEWIDSAYFDVSATSGKDLPPAEIAPRVRRLVAERFKVKAHWETRELPVYALVVAKSDGTLGPRLRRSNIDCAALRTAARGTAPPAAPAPAGSGLVCTGRTIPGTITGGALSVDTLANSLARFAGRIVQNRTGLTGGFDYELTWTPDQPVAPIPGAAPLDIDPNGPSLFTAVEEQLGLKLEAQRGPVEVLVVDHTEPPTPD